jgi:hypothetical protein
VKNVQLLSPLALCLLPSSSSAVAAAALIDPAPPTDDGREAVGGDEKDAVRLFVGCKDGVHAIDLARGGEHKHFAMSLALQTVSSLAVDAADGQLFALGDRADCRASIWRPVHRPF